MDIISIERYDGPLDQLYVGLGIQKGSILRQLEEIGPNTLIDKVLSERVIRQIGKAIGFKYLIQRQLAG